MDALVTGGAGFIGSNLVDRLLDDGHRVTVLDDLSTGDRQNVARAAHLEVGDVREAAALVERMDVVFHLAAQIDVRRSVSDPTHDLSINVGGTLAVLDGARRSGTKVVLASTGGAIYGDTEWVPTPEEAPAEPLAPYGQAKLAAEGYCRLYRDLHGVRTTVLRLANVYGPRQDPLGEGGVVAIFSRLARDGDAVVVYGDGRQTRDFVYVGDVVDAFVAAAGHDGLGPYNIGTGTETSVLELAEFLRRASGEDLPARHEPERWGEVRRSCLAPSRARGELGWRAAVPLEEGLRRTLDWLREGPEPEPPQP